ncbi:MAG: hypothetical protein CBC71_09565 [Rhodobacteraceae bacterium TMED111]|nr:hypothetical protein [Marinovum sp.]OUV39360.1 MAG: hypothetical protein CBC71_09565 [Rhodobacteraceae bacterium TMED111]
MKTDYQNLDGIVDQSLKVASRVIAIVAFPAMLFVAYRNLIIDFVPYHQAFLTICYGIFVYLGFGKIKSNQIRFYSLVSIFFSLFIAAGLRNSSIIFVDVFLVLACGLMAFKFTGLKVLSTGIIATVLLLFLVPETFLPDGEIYSNIIKVHISTLSLTCVLIFAIRNVVEQYQQFYLNEIERNKSLIEKNKSSYDLVAEAQESSEAEKAKLKIAAFSLASQMNLTKILLEKTDKKKNRSQVEYIQDRIHDVSFNLSKISETGNYLSNDVATLTLQELSHILESFMHAYELFSKDKSMKVTVETNAKSEFEYGIPLSSLKVMLHHLISHCQDLHEPKELKCEIGEGRQSQTMKKVQLKISLAGTKNLEDLNLARFNKVMESKLNFETGSAHTNVMKAVLSSLPGTIKATQLGNKIRLDLVFWIERTSTTL